LEGSSCLATVICWNTTTRVSVQGVKSLGSHIACLCREFDFYEVKKNIIIFQKENGNTLTLLIIFIVKSLQKEQNSSNLLL
jgi:hypothetical protein